MFFNKLYVRIWLAVVLAVAVLTLLVGWAWRLTTEPPLREVVVRNEAGEVIGNGHARLRRLPPLGEERPSRERAAPPSQADDLPPPPDMEAPPDDDMPGRFGRGPEFLVRMQDGQTIHMHLPRPPSSNYKAPFGFFWSLGLVAIAVALGTYPIVRRLTRRLETLQHGVERWGDGDLGVRVPLDGDDEVGFLATRFNHAAQQVQSLVQSHEALLASQKSLLANASHELRSPLARIRMGMELMGSSPSPTFKAEIARNINELDQLIEEILLASRLDAKEADMGTVESVDLVGLAAEECARAQATLDTPTATLAVPGIAKLLRRAVRNLLENARRYGAGEVTLVLVQDSTHAVLQVCDRGPGVPEALQDRIFEPFYRLPGASEREGGVGLGLALVKSITQRHGGTVTCSNRPDGGACFEIRLPLQAPASAR
ncbi:MAG: ATP-binding protein [Acidovorax sp.]|uniref:sensor histidine kinase n=1 Tax=Acidovorax sp. TaxID=1872122 RepID=UPI002625DC29|nr:ATP-binding protein [Acidovorax sp.]MDH4464174.1 ATP-binding protein [Acidovorax sp.]